SQGRSRRPGFRYRTLQSSRPWDSRTLGAPDFCALSKNRMLLMYRPSPGRAVRLHHNLRERRVRVNRAGDLLVTGLELFRHDHLRDQVGRTRADDVRAEQLAVLGVADDLAQPLPVAVDERAPHAPVLELADHD